MFQTCGDLVALQIALWQMCCLRVDLTFLVHSSRKEGIAAAYAYIGRGAQRNGSGLQDLCLQRA